VDVRDPVEPRLESLPDLLLADESVAARSRPARRIEDTIVGEQGHDRVDVVGVERVQQRFEQSRRRV
jgi:hypothetical protein